VADTGTLLGLGQGLAFLTYVMGILFQTLPVPRKEIKAWGPTLMADGIIAEFGLASAGLVQLLISWISQTLQQSIGAPFNAEPIAITTIMAQLVSLDSSFLLLISALSVTVVLAPVAGALSSMLSPALTWTTIAIVAWTIIQIVSNALPQIWLSAYALGVVFFAIPLRLGRRFGTLLMASSLVLSVGIPVMPSLAVWLEGYVGYETSMGPLQSLLSQIRSNPLLIGSFLATLPQALAGLLAAVIISLVIFPFAYLFILSLFVRSLANVIGGASSGPLLSDRISLSSRELGFTVVKGEGN
jgi:hypothetical protein